ncbi:MAG: restriction endonuclease subunit S, partial [Spirochaetota bacterium]
MAGEIMSELPKGWDIVPLKEIAVSIKGKKPKILSGVNTKGTVPYIDIKAFEKGEIRQYADINSSNIAGKEDVLVVWDGARSGLVGIGQEGAIGSTILAIKQFCISSKYLYQFLKTKYEYINTNHRGTGIPHVDPEVFWNIEFPIPPLNEQRRIVAMFQ